MMDQQDLLILDHEDGDGEIDLLVDVSHGIPVRCLVLGLGCARQSNLFPIPN